MSSSVIVIGTQWGDEGKGKIVDLLTPLVDVVVRFQGGANAGHTVVIGNQRIVLHLIPSGILHQNCLCILGNGVVMDPKVLLDEMDGLAQQGYLKKRSHLLISDRAHIVMPYHRSIDELREEFLGKARIGTTGRGIGPAYEDKVARFGLRAGDLKNFDFFAQRLKNILPIKNALIKSLGGKPFKLDALLTEANIWSQRLFSHIVDTEILLHEKIASGSRILFEGAQGTALDVDHGTYPYVTSSSTVAGGACTGAGVGPVYIKEVLGITKAYTTRVGNGPFPTELDDEVGKTLQTHGKEFGSTTGRSRRCGWLDAVLVRHSARASSITTLAVTKLDVLKGIDPLRICTGYKLNGKVIDYFPSSLAAFDCLKPVYEDLPGFNEEITGEKDIQSLPKNARNYLDTLAKLVGVPISILSTGFDRQAHIIVKDLFINAG